MTDGAQLAIDAGQTGIRARLGEQEFAYPGIRTDQALVPQLAAVVGETLATRRVHVASFGVSGLVGEEDEAAALLAAIVPFGVAEVHLAHDSVTAYLGALGDRCGAVVAAGTGVVTLAVGEDSVARVDGWGSLIGDAGSGYWVGRAALDAVMRAHDGRGPATALTDAARREFPELESAYVELQSDPGRVRRIAAYAAVVGELAASDEVSAGILENAGAELAASVLAGLRRVGGLGAGTPVRGIGGLFRSPPLADSFARHVHAAVPGADVRPGNAHPLDGAALLPRLGTDSALRGRVAFAARRRTTAEPQLP